VQWRGDKALNWWHVPNGCTVEVGLSRRLLAKSAAAWVAVQNSGRDSTQPIGKSKGKVTSGPVVPGKGGRMMASLGMSFGCTQIQ
jgi:hypothetical protein